MVSQHLKRSAKQGHSSFSWRYCISIALALIIVFNFVFLFYYRATRVSTSSTEAIQQSQLQDSSIRPYSQLNQQQKEEEEEEEEATQKDVKSEATEAITPSPPKEEQTAVDVILQSTQDTKANEESTKRAKVRILYYAPLSAFMGKHMLGAPPRCPQIECEYIEDKSQLAAVDGVVFHIPTFWGDFPAKRDKQWWIAYSMESEEYYTNLKDPAFMKHFDLLMSYKLESEIVAGYFSGNLSNYMIPPAAKQAMNASVLFIASNCAANRTAYVKQLMQYIPVHSYGKCLHNHDFPASSEGGGKQKLNLMRQYKFYLAFENHSAKDYVTEKFFHALYAGTVPVVMGAPNIDEFAPSRHSYINARDFESPAKLAEYLRYLDTHEEEYKKYLQWKYDGPSLHFKQLLAAVQLDARCRLCLKLAQLRDQ